MGVAIGMCLVFPILVVCTGNLLNGLLSALSISCTTVCVIGLIQALDWKLGVRPLLFSQQHTHMTMTFINSDITVDDPDSNVRSERMHLSFVTSYTKGDVNMGDQTYMFSLVNICQVCPVMSVLSCVLCHISAVM